MATVLFQLTSVAETAVTENVNQQGNAPQPAQNTNPNAAAPQDIVTISSRIPPEPLIPFAVPVTPFPGFLNAGGAGGGNNAAVAGNGAQEQAAPATLPPNPPIAPGAPSPQVVNVPAINPPGTDDAAVSNAITNTAIAATQQTPDQELAQLNQTLQQLGIDPQSITLFNRMAMLAFAQNPEALRNLVNQLQSADQQLNQLAALANSNATSAANQPASQAQAQAPAPAQNTAALDAVATQLNFTEVQGAITSEALATGANTGAVQPAQSTAQFQELQLSFSALEIQGTAAAQNAGNTAAQGQTINVNA